MDDTVVYTIIACLVVALVSDTVSQLAMRFIMQRFF